VIRWIDERLGTAAWGSTREEPGVARVDVRDLVDRAGNLASAVRDRIGSARAHLREGRRVLVCCDYGMSRSNAIAAGVLCLEDGIPLSEAVRRVRAATGEGQIQLGVLAVVREAVGRPAPRPGGGTRRYLVTGGAGFLGRRVCERLAGRGEVHAPPRADLDVLEGPVPLDLALEEGGIDTVVHLAHPHVYTTAAGMGEILVGLKNLVDACRAHGAFLVYPSSAVVFSGERGGTVLADEARRPRPADTYGEAKSLAETLLDLEGLGRTFPGVVLRLGPVYGPGSDRPRFLWNFLEKARRGEPIVAHAYDDGHPALDLVHADDAADAIAAAAERRPAGPIHVGTGTAVTTTEVAERLVALVGSRSRIEHLRIAGPAPRIALDPSRARERLGWRPRVALAEGLAAIAAGGPVAGAAPPAAERPRKDGA
jgi:nucleoside-diphosphate-sugar epimerase